MYQLHVLARSCHGRAQATVFKKDLLNVASGKLYKDKTFLVGGSQEEAKLL
jgi:hypothetical protein